MYKYINICKILDELEPFLICPQNLSVHHLLDTFSLTDKAVVLYL